ncbi:hypothetical protein ABK040_011050 [Willaertia magna]
MKQLLFHKRFIFTKTTITFLFFTFLLSLLTFPLSECSTTTTVTSLSLDQQCISCLSQNKIYCALEQVCKPTYEDCKLLQPFNITWFLSESVNDGNLFENNNLIPQHCNTGIITSINDCSVFEINILRQSEEVLRNFVVPMTQQPVILLKNDSFVDVFENGKNNGTNNTKKYENKYFKYIYESDKEKDKNIHLKNNFVIGAFYINPINGKNPLNLMKKEPLYFSYNFHVNHQSLIKFNENNNLIKFLDLSVAVQIPNNYFRLGFGILRKFNTTSLQCSFNITKNDIYIDPDYKFTYMGPHIFLGIPLLIIAVSLLSIYSCCCVHLFEFTKFNKKLLLHDEKDENELEEILERMEKKNNNDNNFNNDNNIDNNEMNDNSTNDVGNEERLEQEEEDVKVAYQNFRFKKNFRNFFSQDDSFIPKITKYIKGLKLAYNPLSVIISLFTTNDLTLVNQCGTDIYYYLWFSKYIIIYTLICGILANITLLPTYLSIDDYKVSFGDFSTTTIGEMNIRENSKIFIFYIVSILFPLVGLGFLYMLRRLSRLIVKGKRNFGSLYTIMVSGIDKDIKDRKVLINDFKNRYGDENVVDGHLALDLSKIEELEEKLEELQMKLNQQKQKEDQKFKIKAEMEKIENQIKRYKDPNRIQGTGYGFITFSSMTQAQHCLDENRLSCCGFELPLWCCESGWNYRVERAPEADDILFENLHVGFWTRFIRSCISNIIITIILCVIYGLMAFVSYYYWFKGQNASEILDQFSEIDADIIPSFVVMIAADLFPEIISLANELVKPIIEVFTEFERHASRKSARTTILHKSVFFICLSISIFPFIVRWSKATFSVVFNADSPFDNYQYFFNFIGTEVATLIMALCTIAKSLEYLFIFSLVSVKYLFTKKFERLPFDYEANIGVKIAILLLCLVYGSAVPVMFAFGLFYFILTFYLDKYLIMYFYERAPDSDGTLMKLTVDTIAYYLSVFPLYVIFLIPSLALLWTTWLFYLPTIFIFYLIIRQIRKSLAKSEMDLIVYDMKYDTKVELEDQLNNDNDIELEVENDTISPNNSATTSKKTVATSINRNSEKLNHFLKYVTGERAVNLKEIYEMESELGVDVQSIASRYRHPYLRKDKRKTQRLNSNNNNE